MFDAACYGYPDPLDEPEFWTPKFEDFLQHALEVIPEERWTITQLLNVQNTISSTNPPSTLSSNQNPQQTNK